MDSKLASTSSAVNQDVSINSGFLILDQITEVEGFAQEVRLTSAEDNAQFNWTIGAFYSDSDTFNSTEPSSYFEGVGASFGVNSSIENSETTALFASIDYTFNEDYTLILGGRYFEDDRTFEQLTPTFLAISKKASFDHFSPKCFGRVTYTNKHSL